MNDLEEKINEIDELINENNDKINRLFGKCNNLSGQISHIIFGQKCYIENILSDRKFKDGLNLTLLKKLFLLLKNGSFCAFLCLLVVFLFNISLPVALLVIVTAIIALVSKDKYIEYSDMISRYEAALKAFNLNECKVDLLLVREKLQSVENTINLLKNEQLSFKEEIESITENNKCLMEFKEKLIEKSSNNFENNDVKISEPLINNNGTSILENRRVLVKKIH